MSDLLELPAGHPQGGFVAADPAPSFGAGILPPSEIDLAADRDEAHETDVQAVADNEHEVATAIHEDRLDTSGLRVSSLIPNFCSISGSELVLLHVYGSGFTPTTQIWWHDHVEPTVFVSDRELTTWVTPWVFQVPDIIDVGVQEPGSDGGEDGDPPPVDPVDGDRRLNFALTP